MNTNSTSTIFTRFLAAALATLLVAGCASAPTAPDGAETVRAKLTQLQSDPELAGRAPAAMQEAERAVRAAEEPQRDPDQARHLVFVADQRIEIARARAEIDRLEEERQELREEREQAVREAREREISILRHREAG
jgi:outer membrane murein-binding lipoprotein Lpp